MRSLDKNSRKNFGKVYGVDGDVAYMHGHTGQLLEMRRRGQKVRFFDMDTDEQVGDEHANVAPAAAWAYANGYFCPALARVGIFPPSR